MILKNQEGSAFDNALIVKARDRSRTDNLIITNDVLRQLSYAGNNLNSEIILKFLVFTIINLHKNTPHLDPLTQGRGNFLSLRSSTKSTKTIQKVNTGNLQPIYIYV